MATQSAIKMRLTKVDGKNKTICYPQTTIDQVIGLKDKLDNFSSISGGEASTIANTALLTASEAKNIATEANNKINNFSLSSSQLTEIQNIINNDLNAIRNSISAVTQNANDALLVANGAASSVDYLNSVINTLQDRINQISINSGGEVTVDLTSINNAIEELRNIATEARDNVNTAIETNTSAYELAQSLSERVNQYDDLINNNANVASNASNIANNALTTATTALENATNSLLNIDSVRTTAEEATTNAATAISVVESYNQMISQMELTISGFSSNINTQNEQIENIVRDNQTLNLNLNNIYSSIQDINNSMSSVVNTASSNNTAIESFRSQIDQQNMTISSIYTNINNLSNENILNIMDNLDSYGNSISSIRSDIDQINNSILSLEENNNSISSIRSDIDQINNSILSLEENNNIINTDNSNIHDRIFEILTSNIIADDPESVSLEYNGEVQKVKFDIYDNIRMTIGGSLVGSEIGTYIATITPKEGFLWNDNTNNTKNVEWSIKKGEVPLIELINYNYTYDGTVKSVDFNSSDENLNKVTITGISSATDAGEYTLTASIIDTEHYDFGSNLTEQNITWNIDRSPTAILPQQKGTLTYDDTVKQPEWEYVSGEETIDGYDSLKLTLSGFSSATNAGEYDAVFTPTSNYAWEDGTFESKVVTWSIQEVQNTEEEPSEEPVTPQESEEENP